MAFPVFFLAISAVASFSAVSSNYVDAESRQVILDIHNNLRSEIARGVFMANTTRKPPATNMLKMKWNETLEASAVAWAKNLSVACRLVHSGSGENLFSHWSSIEIVDKMQPVHTSSKHWASEFNKGWNGTYYQSGRGHATQMAWATTDSIGCAYGMCSPNSQIVVCQYWPYGNIVSRPVYTDGPTCSQCPKGYVCEEKTGLCVAETDC